MLKIKFINADSARLYNDSTSAEIAPSNEGVFTVNEPLSKNDQNYYHFMITGSNVQVSGVIDSVTKKQEFCNLFRDCTAITDASNLILSAPNMKESCYANMFMDCTNLTTPPVIQAQNLDIWCFQNMFAGCESLSSAPVLSATVLAPYCYYAMFYGCSNLSTAPYLPAQTLVDWCYNSMFYNCQNLNKISADFTAWNGNATSSWVTNVAANGKFTNDFVDIVYGSSNVPNGWTNDIDYSAIPLTFKALEADVHIGLIPSGTPYEITYQYNYNNTGWKSKTNPGNVYSYYTLSSIGDTISFRSTGNHFNDDVGFYYFYDNRGSHVKKKLKVYGNVASLINYEQIRYSYTFQNLFLNNKDLVDASNLILPSSSLCGYCYSNMFNSCSSLSAAPQLPATELAPYCYYGMFAGCSSLITAPELPATSLASACYRGMFLNCAELTEAPSLPVTTLTPYCYYRMFKNCQKLTVGPNLPAIEVPEACYTEMFMGCSSLTAAPELPATGLSNGCYFDMFNGCTKLSTAPELPATTLAYRCYREMFMGCTSLTAAPQLPATTLVSECYWNIFNGCSNLSSINVSLTSWTGGGVMNGTTDWVNRVPLNGTFTKPAELPEEFGQSKIPEGWTVVNKN